jgi:hypothetical protein
MTKEQHTGCKRGEGFYKETSCIGMKEEHKEVSFGNARKKGEKGIKKFRVECIRNTE